jgi:hypothetical protein
MTSEKNETSERGQEEPKPSKGAASSIKDSATEFLEEVEKTGNTLLAEVRQLFDALTDKVSSAASAAAETTTSMAEKVAGNEPAQLARRLLQDVKEAGEASLRVIGEGFDTLRRRVAPGEDAPGDVSADKAAATPAEAKAAPAKKVVAKKKVATSRKVSATKQSTTKKAAAKKAAKKKVTNKKVASRKTAVLKKTTKKSSAA